MGGARVVNPLPRAVVFGGGFAGGEVAKPLVCKAPPEDLLTVVRTDIGGDVSVISPAELTQWGAAARQTIEELLPRTGAVLLRGLPMRTPEQFGHFWKGCLNA